VALALAPEVVLSLDDIIRDELEFDPAATDEVIAERALRRKPDILPLVEAHVGQVRRESARRVERKALDTMIARLGPARKIEPKSLDVRRVMVSQELLALRRQHLDLGDGQRVRWGEATVDQLKQRLVMLETQVRGITATMTQLRYVVSVLELAGASCLNELA